MKLKGKPLRALLFSFAFLVLLTGLGYFCYQRGYFDRFGSQSYADLSDQNGSLILTLNIDQKSQARYKAFLNNLNAKDSRKISLNLNKETMNYLDKLLPQRVKLNVLSDKELAFASNPSVSLKSALSGKDYDFATGSAKAHFNVKGERDFSVEIADPAPLLREATNSGNLYLSDPLFGLFPILSKVATIELKVVSGTISGEIKLK